MADDDVVDPKMSVRDALKLQRSKETTMGVQTPVVTSSLTSSNPVDEAKLREAEIKNDIAAKEKRISGLIRDIASADVILAVTSPGQDNLELERSVLVERLGELVSRQQEPYPNTKEGAAQRKQDESETEQLTNVLSHDLADPGSRAILRKQLGEAQQSLRETLTQETEALDALKTDEALIKKTLLNRDGASWQTHLANPGRGVDDSTKTKVRHLVGELNTLKKGNDGPKTGFKVG